MVKYYLERLVVGQLSTNCYILSDASTKDTVVIDPGANSAVIIDYLTENNLIVKAIINTHGHFDHITANRKVVEVTGAPVLANALDLSLFAKDNGAEYLHTEQMLLDGDIIEFGGLCLKVLHTPGHTPGGISLYLAADKSGGCGLLFCGDTLFLNSVGRTDFVGGDFETLLNSIDQKLLILPDDTIVLPGHGPSTTIGKEKEHNPYLRL